MARTTNAAGASGNGGSMGEKRSRARAATTPSSGAKRGTSATPPTEASTPAPSTKPVIGRRRRRTVPAAPTARPVARTPADRCRPRILSICNVGPFAQVALVVMPAESAVQLLSGEGGGYGVAAVLEGVGRDLEAIREKVPELADSALAGTALALATELENPYNSATSKAQCANALQAVMDRLRELTPEQQKGGIVVELLAKRAARSAATEDRVDTAKDEH